MEGSIHCRARFTLGLPVDRALALFTPEGERAWAGEEWDPRYPDPERTEGAGAVFVTAACGRQTVWVAVDATPASVRYVRTTADVDTGIVTVTCDADGAERTTVTVTYDLTALGPEGRAALAAFAAGYDQYIASWRTAIERAMGAG